MTLAAFTVSGATACTASDFVYSLDNGDASFVTFDANTREISYETNDATKVATYTITLIGSIANS